METERSSAPADFVVGVDVGGSKIGAGLVTATGEIRYHTRVPMLPNDGPQAGLATVHSSEKYATCSPVAA